MRKQAALLLTGILLAHPAQGEERRFDLGFHVFAGGYHAMTLTARLDISDGRYRFETRTTTEGLADALFRMRATSESEGRITAGGLKPVRFRTESDGRFSYRLADMRFEGETPVVERLLPEPAADDRDQVPEAMTLATFDPLSAAFIAISGDQGRACTGSQPVFDGRRRYNLHFRLLGEEMLSSRDAGVYSGPAVRCEIEFEPIAGFMKQHESKTREKRPPTQVWLAKLLPDELPMPVRLESESSFGKVTGHLVRARLDDKDAWVSARR